MSAPPLGATAREHLLGGLTVRERRIHVDGVATSVLEAGQGPPLVLLHGGIQAGGVVWWRVIPALAQRHRVVVPDVPGLGESDALDKLDAAMLSGWLRALIATACDEPPTLVAHSALGGLAAAFAADDDHTIGRLVLVDAAGLGRFRPRPAFVAALLRANIRPSPRNFDRFMAQVVADLEATRQLDPQGWDALGAYVASRSSSPSAKRAMRQIVRAGTAQLADAQIQRIAVPTALIWGRRDPLIALRAAEAASATYGWPLRVIDAAGHLPHVECPDAFVEALTGVVPVSRPAADPSTDG